MGRVENHKIICQKTSKNWDTCNTSHICSIDQIEQLYLLPKDPDRMVNRVDPDQTAPVWSDSALFT